MWFIASYSVWITCFIKNISIYNTIAFIKINTFEYTVRLWHHNKRLYVVCHPLESALYYTNTTSKQFQALMAPLENLQLKQWVLNGFDVCFSSWWYVVFVEHDSVDIQPVEITVEYTSNIDGSTCMWHTTNSYSRYSLTCVCVFYPLNKVFDLFEIVFHNEMVWFFRFSRNNNGNNTTWDTSYHFELFFNAIMCY